MIARAEDVAESTFAKFCSPVIRAMLAAFPVPSWPNEAERLRITHEFSKLTGGDAIGWAGLYVNSCASLLLFRLSGDWAMVGRGRAYDGVEVIMCESVCVIDAMTASTRG